ncbi:MAG: acylphosphatase [Deltaproteobacteria bacterium]|nr:acylphosphatase [Deltaproteobacteria bacterium]
MKTSKHVIVRGKVQGVFFRDYTRRQAVKENLTGWVRNLPDGSVEALFSGEEKYLSAMLNWLKQGSPQSRVDSIHVDDLIPDENYTTFEIRY